jgi:hypothetical protein
MIYGPQGLGILKPVLINAFKAAEVQRLRGDIELELVAIL